MDSVSIFMIYSALFGLVANIGFAQTVHIVGDNMGWRIPTSTSVSYSNWASGKTFMVGDILVFNFMTNEHDVVQVPKASYDACSEDNAIGNIITTGPANITLDNAGERYYICSIGGHCGAGQKLSITVVSSSTGGPSPPVTTPPPATPTTPQPDACAPTPEAESPRARGAPPPTGQSGRIPPPPPNSASVSLTSSFLLVIAFAGLAFIF
ncbi:cucumber peeling cupredoxin-like [Salvia hispanica]|uniref:cucumber peeling cupredoxin-like n=1 Tax=Salvia hispanica TaxID=49212 RepID=UPI0020094CAC|nr:cucumber peeling cupredoxin-like [Salvia hispanica]